MLIYSSITHDKNNVPYKKHSNTVKYFVLTLFFKYRKNVTKKRKWSWIGHTLSKPSGITEKDALDWNPQCKRRRREAEENLETHSGRRRSRLGEKMAGSEGCG
jgi:hypothetical protein